MKTSLTRTITGLFAFLFLLNFKAFADVPEALHGTWVIDPETTMVEAKKSPTWSPMMEQMIPALLQRMSSLSMVFTADQLIMKDGENEDIGSAKLIKTEKNKHTIQTKNDKRGEEVNITITVLESGPISITSEQQKNMEMFFWKKAPPAK